MVDESLTRLPESADVGRLEGERYGAFRASEGSASRAAGLRARVAKFLSTGTTGIGPRIDPAAVGGYHLDFRSQSDDPAVLPHFEHEPGRYFWGRNAERGLACFERWLDGEGERWLAGACAAANVFVQHQAPNGGWLQIEPCPHTFVVRTPWVSALGQGQAASLLVRVYLETRDDRYADAALRALLPFSVPSSKGGVCAMLGDRPFPEEYPTQPPSFVLNGAILGLWGLRDVGLGLGDAEASRAFEESVDTLAANIHRWDTGSWSLYDLVPRRPANIASFGYHAFHVTQLEAMHVLSPRTELQAAAERFARYAESRALRANAFARKAMFRIAQPRNAHVAAALPWARS